jgi:serine/threonine-protein phosphatase 5
VGVLLAESHFTGAIESYTSAIELNPNNAVYFANRAYAHIKLEEHGSAIVDGTTAIDLNPRYAKV